MSGYSFCLAQSVIPAKAGIQLLYSNAIGFPPQPALECLNRGRE